jgi:hypothetical protein
MDFTEAYGADPTVLIFSRGMTKPLTILVKLLDAEVAKRKSSRLRAIVVFLSDEEALENSLKEFGTKQKIKHLNLAIMEPDGPNRYKVSKEAEVTVIIYKKRRVEASHAYKMGELNADGVERVLADVSKVASER